MRGQFLNQKAKHALLAITWHMSKCLPHSLTSQKYRKIIYIYIKKKLGQSLVSKEWKERKKKDLPTYISGFEYT